MQGLHFCTILSVLMKFFILKVLKIHVLSIYQPTTPTILETERDLLYYEYKQLTDQPTRGDGTGGWCAPPTFCIMITLIAPPTFFGWLKYMLASPIFFTFHRLWGTY